MTTHLSPLDAAHRALGAKMVPFGGWDMPLQYPAGTLAEHRACRNGAVAFDVSHLGTVRVDAARRPRPAAARRSPTTSTRSGPGRAQYTHLLDDADASVLDDIIVVVGRRRALRRHAQRLQHRPGGRGARRWGTTTSPPSGRSSPCRARRPRAARARSRRRRPRSGASTWRRSPGTAPRASSAGTGYTGEDGVEIAVPAERRRDCGTPCSQPGFEPAGLGARDTLRLEAGLPLHGHELGAGHHPAAGRPGLGRQLGQGAVPGRDALSAERERGLSRRLRGTRQVEGAAPAARGQAVLVDGTTGGRRSPAATSRRCSGTASRMALLQPGVDVGTDVTIDARGSELVGRTVPLPFVGRPTSRPYP